MSENRGLSHSAYGGVHGDDYVPYIPAHQAMPELTWVSIVIGALFAIIFGAANTYLGLKVGMTIAAGIPAAILGTGVLKGLFRRNNILEANMVQAMASMGESLAGGLIFTLPAIIVLGMDLGLTTMIVVSLLGGLLGILFVIPLRRYLIVEEHGKLIYPEGMAASEVLVTASTGGAGFKTVLTGLFTGGAYKIFSGGFRFWVESPEWVIKPMQGTIFGIDAYASLAGVGFIVGIEAASYMFAGALVAWMGLIPLIKYVGAGLVQPLFPSTVAIVEMGPWDIWSKYIRYIGAGAVAAGGFISLGKSMPTIIRSFKSAMSGIGAKGGNTKRTEKDTPLTWVIAGSVFVFLLAFLLPMIKVGIVGAILVVVFSFFFAVVSARIVGIIGTSNNPISGMTIATLLFITATLKAVGMTEEPGMRAAIIAGSIVCVAIAIAGGTGQSLKTTYIIGGTPKHVEWGMYIGIIASAAVVGGVVLMLDNIYGIGSKEIAAPQATLMSMVVKGVMTNQLPWLLVGVGATFGVMVELMGIPVLPFALGLYLPINLSSGVFIGGMVRVIIDRMYKKNEKEQKDRVEKGILISSGLVAGDALVGILIAILAATGLTDTFAFGPKLFPGIAGNPWTAGIMFFALAGWLFWFTTKGKSSNNA